jgi:SAM-dependent methyltransferase
VSEARSFDADWLALRAPADAVARSSALTRRFAEAVAAGEQRPARLLDLAAGTGANLRFLAPRLGAAGIAAQTWRLVDYDPDLLAACIDACRTWAGSNGWSLHDNGAGFRIVADGWHASVRCVRRDLSRGVDTLPVQPGEAVVTTALLDLVSHDWMEGLVRLVDRTGGPVLATLTDDGLLRFAPFDALDATVAGLFEAHQHRDKGFGPALGTTATAVLAGLLGRTGWPVAVRRSAWVLGAESRSLLSETIRGIATAAKEQDPARTTETEAWLARRVSQAEAGGLRLVVGHRDLFAQPKPSAGPTP